MAEKNKNSFDEIKKYFDGKQAETLKRFDAIDQKFVAIDGRFDKLENKIQAVFEQVVSNTEDLTTIKNNLGGIKQKLKQKTPYVEFVILEQRVDKLETKTAK